MNKQLIEQSGAKMGKRRLPDNQSKSQMSVKKAKPNENDDQKVATTSIGTNGAMAQAVPAVALSQNPSLSLLKLNIDCFEKVFDLLSMKDLFAVFNSDKRMQQIVGHCFSVNYANAEIQCKNGGIFYERNVNNFAPFIRKLLIDSETYYELVYACDYPSTDDSDEEYGGYSSWYDDYYYERKKRVYFPGPAGENELRFIQINRFDSIKEVNLKGVCLTSKIDCIKGILSRVEVVKLTKCKLNGELHDDFLVFCEKMKRLCFDWTQSKVSIIGSNNDWLLRCYPDLEHFEVSSRDDGPVLPNLMPFLEKNPKIKTFAANAGLILMNKQTMLNCNVKLDVFAVHTMMSTKELYDFLNALYVRGFYKRLHLYCIRANQEFIKSMASVKGLVKLFSSNANQPIDFSPLTRLKELCVEKGNSIQNAKKVATSLVNLERIYFKNAASISQISTFIEHSGKLAKIKVNKILAEGKKTPGISQNVINLKNWNDKRKKFKGERKVTVSVDGAPYLATKFAMNTVDFDLVELKRKDATLWSHEFGYQ